MKDKERHERLMQRAIAMCIKIDKLEAENAGLKVRCERASVILEDIYNEASRGISCNGVREANKSAFKDSMLTRICMKVDEIKKLESSGSKKEVKK